jgi:hypothetical protein
MNEAAAWKGHLDCSLFPGFTPDTSDSLRQCASRRKSAAGLDFNYAEIC